MLEQFTSQEKKKFLIALLIGLSLGFAANYGLQPKIAQQPNALAEMSSKIKFGTITESVKQCTVVADETVLYSEPSTLTGRVLRSLPNGMQTNHLATVASLDKDAITVFIGGKPYLLGCTGKALQLLHYFYLVFRNLIVGLKGLLVDAQLLLLQIADVTITRHHFIVTTQELFNGLRLSW